MMPKSSLASHPPQPVVDRDSGFDNFRWYAVCTHSFQETAASNHLLQQGYRVFYPRLLTQTRHARQLKTVLVPLFPRYTFVMFDVRRDRWRRINGTYGVSYLITHNGLPAPITKGVVEALHEVTGAEALLTPPELSIGQTVTAIRGPFSAQVGSLARLSGSARVQVLFRLMNTIVPVEMARADIVAFA